MATPKFSLSADRYDMDTFWGRLLYRYRFLDPRGLVYNEAQLKEMQQIMARADAGEDTGKTDDELWTMRFAVEGGVHPTTNEVITPLLRMSAYVPVNVPIVCSMTVPAVVGNPYLSGFVHFTNQTYNCAINYANRSGDAQGLGTLGRAYVVAVSLSLGGAFGASALLKRVGSSGAMGNLVRAAVPFTAVVASGCANVCVMRLPEMSDEGVPISDDEGNVRGKSVAAGRDGLFRCCVARFLWNIPPMVMPIVGGMALSRIPFFASRMRATEGAICLAGVTLGVPIGLAYFKPYATISASNVEPEFQNLKNSKGEPVKEFTFYKGL